MNALAVATFIVSHLSRALGYSDEALINAAWSAIEANWAAVNMQQDHPWADFIINDEVSFAKFIVGKYRADRFIVRCTAENNVLTIMTLDEATSDSDGSAQGE